LTTDLTVDASVWVAAADRRDAFHQESRDLLSVAMVEGVKIVIPAFAAVDVACALARKLRSAARGRQLASDILSSSPVYEIPVNRSLLAAALQVGTGAPLRGADALYAATAQLAGTQLISWDNELVQRASAITPTDWLNATP
jgi:predicted nucleic acid-binding protein